MLKDTMKAPRLQLTTGLVALLLVALLLLATSYEALIASGVIPIGREPGQGARDSGAVLLVVLAALLVGCLVPWMLRKADWLLRAPGALLAPTAAAFMVARYYTFDPYYAPTLRRISDGGLIPGGWIAFLGGLSIVAAAWFAARPRSGHGLTPPVMLLIALTVLFEGKGH